MADTWKQENEKKTNLPGKPMWLNVCSNLKKVDKIKNEYNLNNLQGMN